MGRDASWDYRPVNETSEKGNKKPKRGDQGSMGALLIKFYLHKINFLLNKSNSSS